MEIKSKFQFFRKRNITYLDSSATTQTPDSVVETVKNSLEYKGNPHRGGHILATKNEEAINHARENIARFINATAKELVFTNNTTDSINLAIDSIVHQIKKGDEIIISIAEHHSNMLPFDKLIKKGAVLKAVNIDKRGLIDLKDFKLKLSNKTKIVSFQHCSNVLGSINEVEKIGEIVKRFNKDIIYMVDAAQSVAHIPIDVKKMRCDFLSFSGHKMYGPDGIGGLFVSENIFSLVEGVRMGGGTVGDASIVRSKFKDSLVFDKNNSLIVLEGGTPNVANILGLSEAVNFIRTIGFEEIRKHEIDLTEKLINQLEKIEGVKIYGPQDFANKIGVISFSIKDELVSDVGFYLDKRNIAIRYGSHCAFPLINELGGELLRVSLGIYNDEEDIEKFVQEVKFYLYKKSGLIKNKNMEKYRDFVYYKNLIPVHSASNIMNSLFTAISSPQDTEVVIVAGHFLAVPDQKTNSFYPSIKSLLPEHLHGLLDEFGMTTFPVFTWELGCKLVQFLKSKGIKAKLVTIVNDTTGINELKNSPFNKDNKTAEEYREEFLSRFSSGDLPKQYQEILKSFDLSTDDIIKFQNNYFITESALRGRFKRFIIKNKEYFDGMIDYTTDKEGQLDLSVNILDNQQIKTCRFNTFNSKTGGNFCIIEMAEFIGELFGVSKEIEFNPSEMVNNPVYDAKNKVLVILSPAMCDSAVSRGGELYTKLFLQEKGVGTFKYLNIPLGPDAERYLATGTNITYISDKDNLVEIMVEEEPNVAELWRLIEYKLLYDIDEYLDEMEELFKKLGINKKSKLLDTCVGPGFFCTELLENGYQLTTTDKSKEMVKPFLRTLKEKGINHKVTESTWLDLPKYFKKNSFDLLFNRGNTLIYADGGWNEKKIPDKKKTLNALRKTLKVYYDLLKKGGYLYVDKYRDSEIPSKKVAAKLKIRKTKEDKEIVFYVERKPEKNIRYAQALLRDRDGHEKGLPNMAYDLTEDEMESLLKEVGFSVKKLKLKNEKHFVVWLAKK